MPDIKDTSSNAEYGKYFGICTSYHHSKGCRCRTCPSYPDDGVMMFCSKGRSMSAKKRDGCLCFECPIHDKFGLEGDYFCQGEMGSI